LTTPEGASRLGGAAEGLSDWQSVNVTGAEDRRVTVTALPAQHGPDGTQDATGAVIGFLITTAAGQKIYVSGDTIPFAGTEEIARRCAPVDLAILHLGRVQVEPMPGVTLSMTAQDGVRFAKALNARKVLPIHFEGWAHFTRGGMQPCASSPRMTSQVAPFGSRAAKRWTSSKLRTRAQSSRGYWRDVWHLGI